MRLGNIFLQVALINGFDKFENSLGLKFLRTLTGILSRPVSSVVSRLLISLKTSQAVTEKSQNLCSQMCGNQVRIRSFNVKLEVKLIAKSLALYKEDVITSGTFIMLLNDALLLLHFLLNSRYVLFLSHLHSSLAI